MMDTLGKIIVILGCILTDVFVIKFLNGDFDKKSLRVGRKVAVKRFNIDKNCDEFKTGKIVATRPRVEGAYWELLYAVRFDDGKIRLFREDEIFTFTGWREK